MNPRNKDDYKRLTKAVAMSYKDMSPFRKNRESLIKDFTGSEYGDSKAKKTYLNLLHLAAQIYIRQLAVRAPSAKVTTPYEALRPVAFNLGLACKEAAKEIGLGTVLRRAAMDALFSPKAIVKVGLEYMGKEKYGDEEIDITAPFALNISFDDYFQDMSARSAYKPAFMGDRYYITKKRFQEIYNQSLPDKNGDDIGREDMKNETGEDRVEDIGHPNEMGSEGKLDDVVGLQDIWIPGQQMLVTGFLDRVTEGPLKVISDFDGSEKGPYRQLWFTGVPDNAMPIPPFGQVRSIHGVVNNILTRLVYQVENRKSVVAFKNSEDATTYDNTQDGHAMVYNGQKPEDLGVGTIDQPSLALMIQLKDMFSWATGNLDSLGGLSPMADTAKQDEMLLMSASAQIRDMQDAMTIFARDIFEYIAWAEWTDPVRVRMLAKNIPGTNMTIPVSFSPETRQEDFLKLNFDIIPVSMRDELPEKKLGDIQRILNQVVAPMLPLLQQQGMTIDVQKLIDIASDYSNIPELNDIVIPMSDVGIPGQEPTGNPQPQIGKPAETTRNYVRTSRVGATRAGKDQALISSLLGVNVQPKEQESLFRGVS